MTQKLNVCALNVLNRLKKMRSKNIHECTLDLKIDSKVRVFKMYIKKCALNNLKSSPN